jgi:hypothetical protein
MIGLAGYEPRRLNHDAAFAEIDLTRLRIGHDLYVRLCPLAKNG